jgi:serine/threonine-protein kinase
VCSHHLHPRPIPPSERLGRPLPAALEALLLACLEKDPERRPASAAELRRRLGELAQGDPWSEDAARASWERWRERPDRPARPADALSGTLSVSLVDRSG